MEFELTKENFDEIVTESTQPVMIDFYATWCGPCKMMLPVVDAVAKEYEGKVKVCKLNVDEQPDLAAKYNVMSIPSFFFIKNGETVDSEVGILKKEKISEILDSML